MAMTVHESTQLFDQIDGRLRAASDLATQDGVPAPAHYVELLAQIRAALPQVQALYAANLEQLQPVQLQAPAPVARVGSSRGRQPKDGHTAIHELRRDFFEIVHPLEVLGKWPPDGFGSAPESPSRPGQPKARTLTRGIGKWPPDGL